MRTRALVTRDKVPVKSHAEHAVINYYGAESAHGTRHTARLTDAVLCYVTRVHCVPVITPQHNNAEMN